MADDEDDVSSTTTASFQSKGFPNLLLIKTRLSPNHYRYSLLNNELFPLRVIFSVHSLKEKFASRMKVLCGCASSSSSSEEQEKTENFQSSSAKTEKLILQISTSWIGPNSSTDILEGFLGRWKAKVEKQQQEEKKEQSGREKKREKRRRSNVNDDDDDENTSSTSSDDDDNECDSNNNNDDDDDLHQVLQRIEDEISSSSSNLLLGQVQDQKQQQQKHDDEDDDVRKKHLETKAKFVDHIEMHPRRLLPQKLEPSSNKNENCKTLFSLRRVSELCRNLKSLPTTTKKDVAGRTNHNDHDLLQSQLHKIQLGKTGSCYFIAALISILNSFIIAVMRNRTTTSSATSSNDDDDDTVVIMKQFLEKFFVLEECDFDRGIYVCRFFDHEHSYTWKSITVDDYLVVVKKNPKRELDSLLFSRIVFSHHHHNNNNEVHESNEIIMEKGDAVDETSAVITALSHFWVSILEKAYVKFRLLQSTTIGQRDREDTTHDDDDDTENKKNNSNTTTTTLYELIRKGSFSDAIFHLTGTPCISLKTKLYSTPQHKCSSTSSPSSSTTSSASSLAFWNELREGIKNGSLMLNICTSRNHYEENLSKYLLHQTKNHDHHVDDDGPSASSFSTSKKINIIMRIGHAYSVVDCEDVDEREDEVDNKEKRLIKKEKKVLVVRDPALSVEKKKKLQKLISSSSTSCSPTFFELNFDKLISSSSSSSSRHRFGGQEMFFHRGSAWLGFSNMKLLHKEIFTMMTNGSSETDTNEQTCRTSSDLHHRDLNLSFLPSTTTTKRILFHLRQFGGGNGTDDDDDDDADDDDDQNKSFQALKLLLLSSKKNDQTIVIASSADKFQRRRDVFLEWHRCDENQEVKLMMRIASMKKDKAKPTTGRMALLVFEIL